MFLLKGIKWKFIIKYLLWRGGWWEWFYRVVKVLLYKVLGRVLFIFIELNILLVKIEGVINLRLLIVVSDDL